MVLLSKQVVKLISTDDLFYFVPSDIAWFFYSKGLRQLFWLEQLKKEKKKEKEKKKNKKISWTNSSM